jgi:hypothetical protein
MIVDPVGDVDHDALIVVLGPDIVTPLPLSGQWHAVDWRDALHNLCDGAAEYQAAIVCLCREYQGVAAWSAKLTGKTSTVERSRVLAAFQAVDPMHRFFFLCSVPVLDEGIDGPGHFRSTFRPLRSTAKYVWGFFF